ncbi:YjbH domain-containing protein [Chitinimonas sp. PSY-7]|uniref:YjbH domain-containing protein n=1 Tax=Chitinimonas sp. PSY-7 TaxID=3459088 RepID=UPI004040019F
MCGYFYFYLFKNIFLVTSNPVSINRKPKLFLTFLLTSSFTYAGSNLNAQNGLIQMPDGRISEDGSWRTGVNVQSPYSAFWSSVALVPWLEASGRFTRIQGIEGFAGNKDYGDYGDKAFSAKVLLNSESQYLPAIAFGIEDFEGTGIFNSRYLAASKQIGPLDLTAGYGKKRIDGPFAGVRFRPTPDSNFALVAEYDANNYKSDLEAIKTGVAKRNKGANIGLEYKWGWLNAQLSRLQDGTPAVNAYLSIPLNKKEFIPKIDEPPALTELPVRPTETQWKNDPKYRRNLQRALTKQNFRDIRIVLQGNQLLIDANNTRISKPSRAAGRAAHLATAYAPFNVRELKITLRQAGTPMLTYEFMDVNALTNYFNGTLSRESLAKTISINYASPTDSVDASLDSHLAELDQEKSVASITQGESAGELAQLNLDTGTLSRFRVTPKISTFFNDPSGVLKYDLHLLGSVSARLAEQTTLDMGVTASLLETVSDVKQKSNSDLPHVRSDVAEYKQGSRFKLNRATLNQYFHLNSGLHARASAGIYEEMFGGAGGQILYMPKSAPFSLDLAVDRLKQRDYKGGFKFRDYETTSAIASLNYRMPTQGLTATIRAGRFLAKDEGARFELTRRFQSGVEMGAWYTVTNGHDIQSPGSPDSPYRDKGIFLSLPLNIMLTKDTTATGSYSLSPWTRDVGQMVASPGDLYARASRYIQNREHDDGLTDFGDLDDGYARPKPNSLFFQQPIKDSFRLLGRGTRDVFSAEGINKTAIGLGLVLIASSADKSIDRKAHSAPSKRTQKIIDLGNALPWAGLALSGALSTYEGDDRLSSTAYAAMQAGILSGLTAETGKWAIGRARPQANQGNSNFNGASTRQSEHSFPSSHAAVATAVVTPFAIEYDMPLLYAIPALTQYGRIRSREHWLSDVVAGSLLGAAIGKYTWEWNRNRSKNQPSVTTNGQSLQLTWPIP